MSNEFDHEFYNNLRSLGWLQAASEYAKNEGLVADTRYLAIRIANLTVALLGHDIETEQSRSIILAGYNSFNNSEILDG